MEKLNEALFLLINASAHPNTVALLLAKFLAEYAIFLIPIVLILGWLRSNDSARKTLIMATVAGLAGLFINQLIGFIWLHPRPFMGGIGHTLIPHVADSSFPSDHLTLLWAVSLSFICHRQCRSMGMMLTLLGIPMAWARIYLGVHFPFDMVGAAFVAGVSVWFVYKGKRWLVEPIFNIATSIYVRLFRPLIRRGWVQK
ncbi:MAG: undecaprenyl-diphosphatase [Cytophaga sp.]|nr:undecaprenyl-diphosphatase [Undibacterium sp.]